MVCLVSFFYHGNVVVVDLFFLNIIMVIIWFVHQKEFLLSAHFYFVAVCTLYFTLKLIELVFVNGYSDALSDSIRIVILFSCAYLVGSICKIKNDFSKYDVIIVNKKYFYIVVLFGMLLNFFASIALNHIFVSEGANYLDRIGSTQNNGVTYFFRLSNFFASGNLIFLIYSGGAMRFQLKYYRMFFLFLLFYWVLVNVSRSGIINLGLMLLYIRIYFQEKKISFTGLLSIFILFIFIVSFFGIIRNFDDFNLQNINIVLEMFFDEPAGIFYFFMNRLDLLPMVEKSLAMVDEGYISLTYGMSYIYTFLHAIPRNLWEAKPLLTSALVTSKVYPNLYLDGVSIYPTIMVEGYMNLKYAGVVFSGFLTGILSSWFNIFHLRKNIFNTLIYFSFFAFPMGLLNEGFHSNYFSGVLMGIPMLFFYIKMLSLFKIAKIVNIKYHHA